MLCFVIVPFSPAYSICFRISFIKSCIFVPQTSTKYLKVVSSICTLYALHIAFILFNISGNFNFANSHTTPFFSITLYSSFLSTSFSTKIITTESSIIALFSSI